MPNAESAGDLAGALQGTSLFRGVGTVDTAALAAMGIERRVARGVRIVDQGDAGDALHTILSGSVRVAMLSPDGIEATLAILRPGDSFGELALFDGEPRGATVVALTVVRTLVVPREAFARWLTDRPHVSGALLRALSQRLRRTDALLADFSFVGLPARLARRLIDLHESQGVEGKAEGGTVKITQADLATMLGVSRESVNKELGLLADAGVLQPRRGAVDLLGLSALREIAWG